MTTIEIARIAQARQTTTGWLGRCPAHDDRRPSLSISEGRDGRTLLKCWTGCDTDAIARALGLRLSDLFADDRRAGTRSRRRPFWRPAVAEIESALHEECRRIVARESDRAGFDVAELTTHKNVARRAISRRYNLRVPFEPLPWDEIAPFAEDPRWLICIDGALAVVAGRANLDIEWLRKVIHALPKTQMRVLRLARRFQRELVPPRADGAAA